MTEQWFYTCEGKQMPPVATAELKRLVADGILKPADMLWREGMPRWVRAGTVREIFAEELPIPVLLVAEPSQELAGQTDEVPVRPRRRLPREENEEMQPRRRPAPARARGLSSGCLAALCIGGGLLAVFVIAIVMLVIQQANQRPLGIPIAGGRPLLVPPQNVVAHPGQAFPFSFPLKLTFHDQEEVHAFTFRQGKTYEIKVTTPRPQLELDIDLYVLDAQFVPVEEDGLPVEDKGQEANCYVRWTPKQTGTYHLRFHYFSGDGPTQATVKIVERAADAKPIVEVPEEPLPPGVLGVPGAVSIPKLAPGREHTFKLQARQGQPTTVRVKTHAPLPGTDVHLFVYRERDNRLLGSDTQAGPDGRVLFTLPETEVVRVVVRNVGPVAALCSASFQPEAP